MKLPRGSVSWLLVLVAVVGADLAVGRVLLHDELMLYGVGPLGIAWQVAAFRLWGSRGRSRAFWAGFLLAGSAAFATFAWGLTQPPNRSGELWAFGRLSHELTWASSFFGFWAGHGKQVAEILRPLPKRIFLTRHISYAPWYDDPRQRIWAVIAGSGGLFLTQLVFAFAGGLLARLIGTARTAPSDTAG